MISSLTGRLSVKLPDKAEIIVGGVGYRVLIPLSTYQALPDLGSEVTLATSMQVRENAIDLIGFSTQAEREVFEVLIGVSGVGVKLGLTILSGIKIEDLFRSILEEDKSLLSTISGIGPKTAGRLVLELKDKVAKIVATTGIGATHRLNQVEEAVLALEALGYSRYEARKAVEGAVKEIGSNHNSEVIIREALKVSAT
ncbi:MAG: Holliday junction branch migration protein RuvA [bacterium]|nr:Holliday junction branch migration protein RuvA [bacterium]